ncbi:MAG: VOC family protein [Candidatus Thermoplasmatota archaeon]|nr:VOC family protein [Candidatus Thermoplasmatota archaeon]
MKQPTQFLHAALHCDTLEHAEQFFSRILGLIEEKRFSVDKKLASHIFNLTKNVEVIVYGNHTYHLEIFLTEKQPQKGFQHLCLAVPDIPIFIASCKTYGLHPYEVPRGEKTLLFVHDFVGNLYEIKQQ